MTAPPPHDEPVAEEPFDPDDDLFDVSFEAPRRTNRLTAVLIVALLVVAGFAGGVLVQKRHDTFLAAAAVGAGDRRSGGGRQQGSAPTAAPGGTGAGDSTGGSGGDAAAGGPVVDGTVRTVNKDSIEVTDRSGAIVRVFVPQTATVTTRGLGGLVYDAPVSVAGTKDVDGSVTATSVTVRGSGG
ncbi:MAG: hypothetical protein QOK35_3148 [Pseudonocardiales bacterium]|nr:hypothetical protein [Pseudonocardiales bacterium]